MKSCVGDKKNRVTNASKKRNNSRSFSGLGGRIQNLLQKRKPVIGSCTISHNQTERASACPSTIDSPLHAEEQKKHQCNDDSTDSTFQDVFFNCTRSSSLRITFIPMENGMYACTTERSTSYQQEVRPLPSPDGTDHISENQLADECPNGVSGSNRMRPTPVSSSSDFRNKNQQNLGIPHELPINRIYSTNRHSNIYSEQQIPTTDSSSDFHYKNQLNLEMPHSSSDRDHDTYSQQHIPETASSSDLYCTNQQNLKIPNTQRTNKFIYSSADKDGNIYFQQQIPAAASSSDFYYTNQQNLKMSNTQRTNQFFYSPADKYNNIYSQQQIPATASTSDFHTNQQNLKMSNMQRTNHVCSRASSTFCQQQLIGEAIQELEKLYMPSQALCVFKEVGDSSLHPPPPALHNLQNDNIEAHHGFYLIHRALQKLSNNVYTDIENGDNGPTSTHPHPPALHELYHGYNGTTRGSYGFQVPSFALHGLGNERYSGREPQLSMFTPPQVYNNTTQSSTPMHYENRNQTHISQRPPHITRGITPQVHYCSEDLDMTEFQ